MWVLWLYPGSLSVWWVGTLPSPPLLPLSSNPPATVAVSINTPVGTVTHTHTIKEGQSRREKRREGKREGGGGGGGGEEGRRGRDRAGGREGKEGEEEEREGRRGRRRRGGVPHIDVSLMNLIHNHM